MRLTLIAVLFLLSAALTAQAPTEAPKAAESADDKPAEPDISRLETTADLNAFIKKYLPGVEPGGQHDFTRIQNPSDKEKRHAYTHHMGRLLLFYMKALEMGAMFSKHFDQLSRTELANQPVFNTLHAMVLITFPPNRPNVVEAEKLLSTSIKQADNFEYPYYLLARINQARVGAGADLNSVLKNLNRALELQPKFVSALLLKAELLLSSPQGSKAEAARIVEQVLDMDVPQLEEFISALGLYGLATGTDALIARVEAMLASGKLNPRQRAHARAAIAQTLAELNRIPDALKWMDDALKDVTAAEDAQFIIAAKHFVGKSNTALALDVRRRNPNMSGETQRLYEGYVVTAELAYKIAAEYERNLLPVDLRGPHAEHFVVFTDVSMDRPESAAKWLDEYLRATTLSTRWRTVLESRLQTLLARTSGDESAIEKQFRVAREKGDTKSLLEALGLCIIRMREGKSLKSGNVLRELIEQLDYNSREVVALAAMLAADTAKQRGGDDVIKTSEAITRRLEKEKECVNEEQSLLQKRLAQAVKSLGVREHEARAVRHLKSLVDAFKENRLSNELVAVLLEWLDDAWLEKLGDGAPAKLNALEMRRPANVGEFLDDLAKQLDKLAKEPPKDG